MRGVKPFIVLTVAAFYFAIVPWRKRTDELVANPVCQQMSLKHSRLIPVCGETVGKFRTIIRSLYEPPSGEFIQSSVLEELLPFDIAIDQTGSRDELDVDLDALTRMLHLLVRLRDILGIGWMDRHNTLFP